MQSAVHSANLDAINIVLDAKPIALIDLFEIHMQSDAEKHTKSPDVAVNENILKMKMQFIAMNVR